MITSSGFFKQHKFTIISTAALLTAGLPIFSLSPESYGVLSGVTLLRGFLLYGAIAHSVAKEHEEYAERVLESNALRKALAGRIMQACHT